jgi:hypothetical protein
MGEIIEIFFFMFVIAGIAFLPLGYFIYQYSKDGEKPPFSDFEHHENHGESAIDGYIEKIMSAVKGKFSHH